MALASASQRGTQSCFARALPFQALAPLTGLDPRAGNARCLFCSSGCSTLFPALFFNCCPCSQFGLRPFPGNSIREVPSSAGNSIWCKILESSLIFWAQLNLMLNWDKIPPAYLNLILQVCKNGLRKYIITAVVLGVLILLVVLCCCCRKIASRNKKKAK